MTLTEELNFRGFINQTTYKDLSILNDQQITFYWGVDPSAPSMTIGNLAAAMMAKTFMTHGHKAILLVGGATGLIGDPDGKSEERNLKTRDEIEANKKAIINQYKQIFRGHDFDVVDNYDWFKGIGYLDFLRDIGKHVPMRQMLGRDFVETRLSENGAGISYAEFSYVLIQAYDFYWLNQHKGVTLQLCGSDQWGNSIAGVDLTRRLTGNETHVWSTPLIVNKATGKKFGKSEEGAVWLDDSLTSVYKFYQFWLNADDEGVADYLKIYTNINDEELSLLMAEFDGARHNRVAQKALAYSVTSLVHGQDRADEIVRVTESLFGKQNFIELEKHEKQIIEKEFGSVHYTEDLADLLVNSNLASSKTEARRFLEQGSITVNGQKAGPTNLDLFVDGLNLVKKGKNSFAIVNK